MSARRWLLAPTGAEWARLRLLCWPYAGLGPSLFVNWSRRAPDTLAICGVRTPGHEDRFAEPSLNRLPAMLAGLTAVLAEDPGRLRQPYALLGCSFGAIAAFELARQLVELGFSAPAALIVISSRPPYRVHPIGPFSSLDDDELLDRLDRDYGGVPAALKTEEELLRLFLPALRGDLEAMEHYQPPVPPARLPRPVFAITGVEDRMVPSRDVEQWLDYGGRGSHSRQLPGGHFLVREDPERSLAAVLECLAPWLA